MREPSGKSWAFLAIVVFACSNQATSNGSAAAGLGGGGLGGGGSGRVVAGAAGSGAGPLGGGAPLGGGGGAPSDAEAPSVVSVTPKDGARGVRRDAKIVLTFSEPMNMASVQRAFASPELGVNDVSLQWNLAGTELTVTPNRPLAFAAGDENVEPFIYHLSLTTGATDLAGNPLPALDVSFGTVRRITRTLLPSTANSGTLIPNGDPGSSVSAEVGERSSSPTVPRRGFFTFDLDVIERGTQLEAATLRTVVTEKSGDPFGKFTTLRIEFLRFDTFETTDYDRSGATLLANVTAAGTFSHSITAQVQADLDDPTNELGTQIRVQFPSATGGHGIHIAGVAPTLDLIYFAE